VSKPESSKIHHTAAMIGRDNTEYYWKGGLLVAGLVALCIWGYTDNILLLFRLIKQLWSVNETYEKIVESLPRANIIWATMKGRRWQILKIACEHDGTTEPIPLQEVPIIETAKQVLQWFTKMTLKIAYVASSFMGRGAHDWVRSKLQPKPCLAIIPEEESSGDEYIAMDPILVCEELQRDLALLKDHTPFTNGIVMTKVSIKMSEVFCIVKEEIERVGARLDITTTYGTQTQCAPKTSTIHPI
jgi:hypothetical protein